MLIETEKVDWSKKIVFHENEGFFPATLVSMKLPSGNQGQSTLAGTFCYAVLMVSPQGKNDVLHYCNKDGCVISGYSAGQKPLRRIYNIAIEQKAASPLAEIGDKVEGLGDF